MRKTIKLEINEIQASLLQRICKEEILKQRMWKEEEISKKYPTDRRDYLSAQMWEIIEQLCSQNIEEYFLPHCMFRTNEEEVNLDYIKSQDNK